MKGDWVQVPGAPQTYKMETDRGTFQVQPTRGYPKSRTFIVKHNREVISSIIKDAIVARQFAEKWLQDLEQRTDGQVPPQPTVQRKPRPRSGVDNHKPLIDLTRRS